MVSLEDLKRAQRRRRVPTRPALDNLATSDRALHRAREPLLKVQGSGGVISRFGDTALGGPVHVDSPLARRQAVDTYVETGKRRAVKGDAELDALRPFD